MAANQTPRCISQSAGPFSRPVTAPTVYPQRPWRLAPTEQR